MDLGLGLEDDDIFDNCHERTKEPCLDPYSARLCPELWFNKVDISGLSNVDAQTITKYRGDVAYQEEQYDSALLMYQRCEDLLQPNNISMRRGVEEDRARCHLRLGQLNDALDCARNVVALAQNFEQVTAVLVLLLDIYEAAGKMAEMLCAVKKLLLLHPNNSGLWIQLGDLHSSKSSCTVQTYDATCQSQPFRTWINDVEGQVKPSHCSKKNSQTTPDTELGSAEVTGTLVVENCEKLKNNDLLAQNPPLEDSSTTNATKSICDRNGSVPVEMNGQIVATLDAGNFSDAVLDQFESMSCDLKCRNETSLQQSSREHDRLVISLTCFLSARLLLRNVHCRLNSFAKARNVQDQLKVESRLDSLLAQSDMEEQLQRCSEFLKAALNLTEADESIASTNKICDMTPRQILCEDERSMAAFDKKWLSWIKEDASNHEELEFKTI